MSEQLVTDLESLFRYSGLLDQVRDTAKYLARVGAPQETVERMAKQYNEVESRLRSVIRQDLAREIDTLVGGRLDPTSASVADVYSQAAALARWVDVVHQTPQFLLSQEVAIVNAREVKGKVASLLEQDEDSPARVMSSSLGTGQYL